MDKKIYRILSVVLCIMLLSTIVGGHVYAAESDTYSNERSADGTPSEKRTVFDNADLLTDKEENALEDSAEKYMEEYGVDVIFLTEDDVGMKSAMTYSDDFMDELIDEKGYSEDGILFFIDMDNREIYVNTVGECIAALNDAEIERVLDKGYNHIVDGEYYDCLAAMAKEAFKRMDDHFFGDGDTGEVKLGVSEVLLPSGLSIFVSLIVAGVAVGAGYAVHNAAMKATSAKQYQSKLTVVNRQDQFVGSHETVQRGYYSSSSGSGSGRSSGGSSHRSSSGRSHGGGGRRF